MRRKKTKNIILGCTTLVFSAVVYFLLIPKGVYVPENIPQVIQSPAFFPVLVTLVIAFFGFLLMVMRDDAHHDAEADQWKYKDLGFVLLLFISYYILLHLLGFLFSSIAVLFFFMIAFGARNWKTVIGTSVLVPVILYYFFKNIQVNFPSGVIIDAVGELFLGR
jgi:putative tricarboxylic transport membrane protein